MGNTVKLIAYSGVELGHPMTQCRHPQRRDRVEIPATLDIDQLPALAPIHDDRNVVGVTRHLGEPMPNHPSVAAHPLSKHIHSNDASNDQNPDPRPASTTSSPRSNGAARVSRPSRADP